MSRPAIPMELMRAVLLEAGHRCAIPTCRHPTTEMAHIIPWADVKKHAFENLIALCPNCHSRYDKGDIDRKSMQAYKRNLPVVASRYNDLERRVIAQLGAAVRAGIESPVVIVPGGSRIMFLMAEQDGLLEYRPSGMASTGTPFRNPDGTQLMVEGSGACVLTEQGREFADKWLCGREITPLQQESSRRTRKKTKRKPQ